MVLIKIASNSYSSIGEKLKHQFIISIILSTLNMQTSQLSNMVYQLSSKAHK